MKGLIITEKPSVSLDITKALGGFKSVDDGSYWQRDDYICTYAVGHLLEIPPPDGIDEKYKKWSFDYLPIIPKDFQLKEKSGQSKRLKLIKKFLNSKEISHIVNACDAAREGELIFKEIIKYYNCRKQISRLWLQSMTKQSIIKAFDNLKKDSEVKGLALAAECRAYSDWIIGMNCTRAMSIRMRSRLDKTPWSIGRVQTPTLSLLVSRELEVLQYRPKYYNQIIAKFKYQNNIYEGIWFDKNFKKSQDNDIKANRIFDKKKADEIISEIKDQKSNASETKKEKIQKPPNLFNLTNLQKTMNQLGKWSSKRTLRAAQRCYETHKVITYPRTDSICLPQDYKKNVDNILNILSNEKKYSKFANFLIKNGKLNIEKIFNDLGVSDHFAIIPTGQITNLEGDDYKLFDIIVKRFLAVFFPNAVYEKIERITNIANHIFKTGPIESLIKPGWLEVYNNKTLSRKDLLPLEKNGVDVNFLSADLTENYTKPPPRIGEAKLLSLMENAGKDSEDERLSQALIKTKGLGTAATRADIIENLKQKLYVDQNLRPTPKGIKLIVTLQKIGVKQLTSADLTGQIELHLSEVEDEKRTDKNFMKEISVYVKETIDLFREFDFDKIYLKQPPIGICPVCKSKNQVFEKSWFYTCELNENRQQKCPLIIWKEFNGRYIDKQTVKELIENGETNELDGFVSSSGQNYKAKLKLEHGKVRQIFTNSFDISKQKKIGDPIGPCPICKKGDMIELESVFACENKIKKDCQLSLPKIICKKDIEREDMSLLIEKGETNTIRNFISKKGRKFAAKLKLKENGQFTFNFANKYGNIKK